ncbi:MAG: biotin/lipoyl-binding protein [Armatimonadota bacterium]|jgi:biotin carboxyl carrier protein
MDAERIKAIVELTKASGACEIALETADETIRVRRLPRVAQRAPAPEEGRSAPMGAAEAERVMAAAPDEYLVRAANVGWFHRGAGPDTEPLVDVGDRVRPDEPLGTIETLKLSNQVVSEVGGEIKEILVEEGMEVEFGQPLFVLDTDTE